jgi:uncharacterized coiled-coil protein SlyX
VSRVEQVENRISGTEDKVEELDQTVKDHERMLRKYKWNMQAIWDTMKRPNLESRVWKKKRYKLKALTTYSIE